MCYAIRNAIFYSNTFAYLLSSVNETIRTDGQDLSQMNIAAHMLRAGKSHPEHPAIANGATVAMRYGKLADRVSRLASALRKNFSLNEGDRVALVMNNCPEYVEVLYACWHAGLVAVPVNAKLHPNEFRYILENCEAKFCFATHDLSDTLAKLSLARPISLVDVSEHDYQRMLKCEAMPLCTINANDPAWLFYTSGTTGLPKGAVLTHRNLITMCWCYFADVDQQSPWLSILHAAPMSHGSGLYALAHVMQASCQVIPESRGFDAEEIYKLIEAWPSLVFFAAPTMVKRLLNYSGDTDTTNLKTIIYGGGPMYIEDLLVALDRFGPKLAQLYGQGESPMTITALNSRVHGQNKHPRWKQRLASVGIAQSAVEVRVADKTDRSLPTGEIGEILVRGDSVMKAYWKLPDETAKTLRNGWLYTGDIGCFDEEGFLTLKDRGKDLIISGGSNIYPREVEEALLKHAEVAEASVIGSSDREWGERVVAYIVPKKGQPPGPELLDKFCIDHIARFKRPRQYRFVAELPKNNYGKVLKTVLREWEKENDY